MLNYRLPERVGCPLLAAVIAAVTALPYLGCGPVWDDHVLVAERLRNASIGDIARCWVNPVGQIGPATGYFRPLALTAMAIASQGGFITLHLLTLLVHAGSAALLAVLLAGKRNPLAGALLFATHPIASEVLGWSSALPDALAVHLGLWSILLANRFGWGAFLLVLAAGLSKEVGVVLLPAGVLANLAPRRSMVPWSTALSCLVIWRFSIGIVQPWDLQGKLPLVPVAITWPILSLLFPWPLTAVRDLHVAPSWVVPFGVLIICVFLLVAFRSRMATSGFALILSALLVSLPPTLSGYLAAERYVYAGLVGLAFIVADRLPRFRFDFIVGMVLITAAFGLHIRESKRWRDDLSLFSDAVKTLPLSSFAWHFYGVAQLRAGLYLQAAESFERSFQNGHPVAEDWTLILSALVLGGKPEEALQWAESGPRHDLTAEYVAWWARAARDAGALERARRIILILRRGGTWDGPEWVPDLARDLGIQEESEMGRDGSSAE